MISPDLKTCPDAADLAPAIGRPAIAGVGPGAASVNDPAFADLPARRCARATTPTTALGSPARPTTYRLIAACSGTPDAASNVRPNGDIVKYLQDTNEFGVITPNNIIRTYFNPTGGAKYFLNDIYKWTGLSF